MDRSVPPPAAATEPLKQRLRRAQLRATPSRLTVLGHLMQAPTPLSHADLMRHMAAEGFDRATIYRNLMDLTRAGLVQRTDRGDHLWRFALSAEPPANLDAAARTASAHRLSHPHFVCTACGDVECLPETDVAVPPRRSVPQAVRSAQVEVQLRGVCDRC